MPERSVTIRISATDNFSDVMRRYSTAVGGAEGATERAARSMDRDGSRMAGALNAIGGAIAAIGVQQVINLASELNNLGAQRTQVEALFNALGGKDQSTQFLDDLRTSTGGIVDDVTLMGGAAQLLRMGLAGSNEEAAQLVELAVRLKKPTDDAASALDNFGLLLANNSILRLDSFGISSGRARLRIEELLESGQALTRDEAFKMAVIELGTEQLERLGSAAHAAETPLARLQTTVSNLVSQFGQRFNTGLEGVVGLLEVVGTYGTGALSDPGTAGEDYRRNQEAQAIAALAGREGQMSRYGYQGFLGNTYYEIESIDAGYRRLINAAMRYQELTGQTADSVGDIQMGYDSITGYAMELAPIQQRMAQELLNYREGLPISSTGQFGTGAQNREQAWQVAQDTAKATVTAAQAMYETADHIVQAAAGQRNLLQLLTGSTGETRNIAFDHDTSMALWRNVRNIATDIAGAATDAFTFADNLVRAAAAAERMSLSDVFGQQGGGRLGEITDALIDLGKERDVNEETLYALQRALDVSSGRQNAGSLALQEQLLPALLQIGATRPDMAAQAASLYAQNAGILAALGISPEMIGANTLGLAGLERTSPNQGRQIAGMYARDGEGGTAQYGATDAQTIMDQLTGGAGELNTEMSTIAEQGAAFSSSISAAHEDLLQMVTGAKQIVLDIGIGNMSPMVAALLELISNGGIAAAMAGTTVDNGGQPPGASNQTATATRGVGGVHVGGR